MRIVVAIVLLMLAAGVFFESPALSLCFIIAAYYAAKGIAYEMEATLMGFLFVAALAGGVLTLFGF